MNRKWILPTIILMVGTMIVITALFIIGPLLDKRITAGLNEKYPDYSFEIEKVNWSLISSNLELNKITIASKTEQPGAWNLNGEIASVELKGISLIKALFQSNYQIDEVIVSNSILEGNIPPRDKEKRPILSTLNLQIGNLIFDKIDLSLKDPSSDQTLSVKEGVLNIMDLEIEKLDTLGILNHFDFKVQQIRSVSPDSMYTYQASGIVYSDTLKNLSIDSLLIAPNYMDYDFTKRFLYENNRLEADFKHIILNRFSATDYFNTGNLISSYIAIGSMDLNVFRDKRKKDSPLKKPALQELVYNFPGLLHIDSIGLNGGSITYIEHAEKANEPGKISMNELKVNIYNITNDSIYKTKDSTMEMRLEALLMGKSKMTISMKMKLFDHLNTFLVKGSLAEIAVRELNPILEKNAFVYANSAKIDQINFDFSANDHKSTGKMIMLYHDLDVDIKNKRTDETKALKERIVSLIVNKKTWDSNPIPGEKARVGIIDYERDSTKFIFYYCIKSIVSGIKSSIIKDLPRKKTFLQKIFSNEHKKQKDPTKN